jgi:RecA-family ATPase
MSINTISAAELVNMDLKPLPEIVEGVLSVGYTILAGAPKAGKSWVSLGMALAVANGMKAFGLSKVEKSDVLYLALEDHHYRLSKRLKMLTANMDVPHNLKFSTEFPKLADGGLESIHNYVHANQNTKLVIIDTLGRVSDEKKGDLYQEDYAQGAAIQSVALLAGVAILAVHHTNKAPQKGVTRVSGTYGVSAAADGVMILTREGEDAPRATLDITGRDLMDKKIPLEWYPPTGGWLHSSSYKPPAKSYFLDSDD